MIAWLLSLLNGEVRRPMDLTGATDGHFLLWNSTKQVAPDFSGLKSNKGRI